MNSQRQQALAEQFQQLHLGGTLVLPNAWDAGSARVLEAAGCPAIATSSSAVSWSYGVPDGEHLTRTQLVEVVERIVRTVSVPVSVDIEAGYGEAPEAVADTVHALIAVGAVGINLEDAPGHDGEPLLDVAAQCARLKAARDTARAADINMVINARSDVYLLAVGDPATRFERIVQRLNAYRAVGADCLFAPGVKDADTIARLVQALDGPLNILAGPGSLPIDELRRLGVARVSLGGAVARGALALVQRVAHELLEQGTYHLLEGAPSHDNLNALFVPA